MTADDFIFEFPPPKKHKRIPLYIPLYSKDGNISYMKLRSKRVIRFHKFSNNKNPHEFYFTEMQKYLPFVDEEELYPGDIDKCKNLYESKLDEIGFLKNIIFPHLESVTEGREKAEQLVSDIGDILDANKELEDDIAQQEGEHEIPEMAVKDPASSGILNVDQPPSTLNNGTYRKIDVQDDKELYAKVRGLDFEQRFVIDKAMTFARQFVRADNQIGKNDWPAPPQMVVLGNGGTGKSHVIDILSQLLQKTFSRSGDNPDHPYVLRLAFTGNAALLIKGQTLNSVFNLPFGNDMNSLMDKIRDMRRTTLQNLRLIIIDEISLVKSGMLYQIHFRLSREIKQNNLPFGNLGLICFGDILQIKPPSGQHVFGPPKGEKNYMEYLISPLWQSLSPVILKTNHRQGEDKEYADICNRARTGQLTDDDIDKIKSHIFPKNSSELPKNAIFSTGTNAIVTKYNIEKLNELPDTNVKHFKAKVFSSTQKEIKSKVPVDSGGMIKNCGLPYELNLKKGARVMMTSNIDVIDGLVNGTMGEVVGFEEHANGSVKYVMVKFDNPEHGQKKRKEINLEFKYPGATAIGYHETEFTVRNKGAAKCTAINIPLRLSWALTLHKMQGHNIKKPMHLILDLECWLQPAMVYVGLSRAQSLSQLYILDQVPWDKIVPWPDAMKEMARLEKLDLTITDQMPTNDFEIVSLNTISLVTHYDDIRVDPNLMSANVLLLQETSLPINFDDNNSYNLPNKMSHFNSRGHRKGLATYFPPGFRVLKDVAHDRFQMSSVSSDKIIITNVYRSKDAGQDFLDALTSFIQDKSKIHILLGDWNFCQRDEMDHPVKIFLQNNDFETGFSLPQASHIKGRCLDQIYIYFPNKKLEYKTSVKVGIQ